MAKFPTTHKTSRDFYEKYERMARERGITLRNSRNFLGYSHVPCNQALAGQVGCLACWHCMYLLDDALNRVRNEMFDAITFSYNTYHRRSRLTLAEGTCLYKHLIKYEILGLEPEFTD